MTSSKIETLAARVEPLAYAVLRIVAGAMFGFHGAQKIFGWYSTFMPPAGSQLWVGGIIELVTGVLLVVGLFTRVAAFIASGEMAVAYTQFHWKLAVAGGAWLPAVNKGELALLYCFLFLFVAAHGAGIASIDARRRRT
jgi:putative oxidoreductase